MYYDAIVTSASDKKGENRIKVFIPSLMQKLKFNKDATDSKDINVNFSTDLHADIASTTKVSKSVMMASSIIAYPAQQNGSSSNGSSLTPEVGDYVSVFFMNEDWSQCFYMENMSPYVSGLKLGVSALMEDGDGARNLHKVLYKSRKNSIVAINDNDGKESVMLKSVGNKVHISSAGDFIDIFTHSGFQIKVDDKNKKISLITAGGQSLIIDDGGSTFNIICLGNTNINSTGDTILTSGGSITISGASVSIN